MNPNEHNPRFKRLVNTADMMFWKFGIRRITIDELCLEANISKMTFYKFFENKIELAKYILEKKMDEGIIKYRQIMDTDIPFTKKIAMSVKLKMEQTENLSQEFLTDVYRNPDTELFEFFESRKNDFLNEILNDYSKAQKSGHLRKNLKPEFILYFLNHMFEMAKDEELYKHYDNAQELIMELTNFFFYGIMTEKNGRKKST
ncbi:MAG: TetR/AcrR family transcriptional regulator [Bacteroidales bacterium]|nr:TetR/AcrR family transcriptional regulator [Bacteroidales bacterium]